MSFRGCLLALLLFPAALSFGAERTWELKGRIVDQEAQPVAGVSVTTVWNANGVTLEQLREFQKDGKVHPELTANEGRMEPWGEAPAVTDAAGNFSITLTSTRDYKLLAIDQERKRGALIIVDPRKPPARVECKLVPLIHVHGKVRVGGIGEKCRDLSMVVGLRLTDDFPLGRNRLAICSSVESRFEFWLPPGDYVFEAFGHDPPNLELAKSSPITLTKDLRDLDCGILELAPRPKDEIENAKTSGTWEAFTEKLGEPCPAWQVVDARGIKKEAKASDFRGKWVLIYFWGLDCAPCLETLPKLGEFYETHQADRDRFEIVSICSDFGRTMKTMADLDRKLKPIVKAVWGGKELPFPVLLDNTYKTMERFGVDRFGTALLIDPAGRLVKGDQLTLEAILEEGKETRGKKSDSVPVGRSEP